MKTTSRTLNQRLKGWPAWILLVFVVVGLLAVGGTRDTGPRTAEERVQAITERLACPVCDGESVADSRNPASAGIRTVVEAEVAAGVQSDDEIIEQVTAARQGQELLVPTANGIQALAWALPATAFVIAIVGLFLAFQRWRDNAAATGRATDDDYDLVAAARAKNIDADVNTGQDANIDIDADTHRE